MITEVLITAGAAGTALAVKAYANIFALEVHRVDLAFRNLPESFDGFRILHLTDLHTRKWGKMEQKLSSILEAQSADIVVFTGDLVTSESGLEPFCQLLRVAVSRCPTYVVFGNTEHKHWNHLSLVDVYGSTGAKILVNASSRIQRGGQEMWIVGVDDPFMGHARFGRALTEVTPDGFKVLLAHAPIAADHAVRNKVSLMLSGHTHGGQVRLPVIGAVRTHLPRYRKLVMGLFEKEMLSRILGEDAGDLKVYVSRGVGVSYAPIRTLCPPEIPLFVLRRA